jgi:hypothetical protein
MIFGKKPGPRGSGEREGESKEASRRPGMGAGASESFGRPVPRKRGGPPARAGNEMVI